MILIAFYTMVGLVIGFVPFFLLKGRIDSATMTVATALIAALGALCLLMVRETKAIVRRRTGSKAEEFMPTYEQSRRFMFFIGFIALAIGLSEIFALLNPSNSWQMSRLSQILACLMGPLGLTVVSIGTGVIILLYAWKQKREQK